LAVLTPVPPLATATVPVTFAALPVMSPDTCPPLMLPVIVPAVAAGSALARRLAVMVAAEKLPLASRDTRVLAVFADVALVLRLSGVPPRESEPPPVRPLLVLRVTELF